MFLHLGLSYGLGNHIGQVPLSFDVTDAKTDSQGKLRDRSRLYSCYAVDPGFKFCSDIQEDRSESENGRGWEDETSLVI